MRPPGRIPLRTGSAPLARPLRAPLAAARAPWPRPWLPVPCRPAAAGPLWAWRHHSRAFSKTTPPRSASGTASGAADTAAPTSRIQKSYFLSNGLLDRFSGPAGRSPGDTEKTTAELPPHRRRQAERRAKRQAASTVSSSTVSSTVNPSPLPANASSVLTDAAARHPSTSLRRLASVLLSLAKPRLTVLVVLSAMVPYALYPVPAFLSPAAAVAPPSLSPLTLLFLTTGTALCSAAANALNMLYEPDTDARMSRTRNRPLVRALVSRRAALAFAAACAVAGLAALQYGVNGTTAFLGAANIALYAGVYTPMKRLSAANTWVGALVGGIPPLMGWAAAAGESATGRLASTTGSGETTPGREFRELLLAPGGASAGGWLFAALLFAWQFPHFMALSWAVRDEYRRAGLRMLCWVHPARNGRVALRYSLAFVPICVGLCAAGVTEWSFAATSLPINLWLVREAVRFWRFEGHQGSARGLFWASVWHLPVVMVLALLQKKGMWARIWHTVAGQPEDDWEDDDEDDDALETLAPRP